MLVNKGDCFSFLDTSILCGYSDIYYKGDVKTFINLWVHIKRIDYHFSVNSKHLTDMNSGLRSVRNGIIPLLDMNDFYHIKFKNFLLN